MGTTIIFDWEAGDNILIKCERVARVGGQVTAPPTRDGLAVTSRTGYQISLLYSCVCDIVDILEVQECCVNLSSLTLVSSGSQMDFLKESSKFFSNVLSIIYFCSFLSKKI